MSRDANVYNAFTVSRVTRRVVDMSYDPGDAPLPVEVGAKFEDEVRVAVAAAIENDARYLKPIDY